jgi:lysophospholipase L1-like esterase
MRLAVVLLAACAAPAQNEALLNTQDTFALYERTVQLMESTAISVPGLARAGAPVIENTKQSIVTLRGAASPQDGALHLAVLVNVRAYLSLADALPKPFPYPEEGRRQFVELRTALERAEANFRALLDWKERQLRNPDRDQLARYAEANTRVSLPAPGNPRVVFLGDSITDGWRLNEYFPERDFINRGISGQITGQMLGRMQADVIALKPAAVLILAGTNDIARGVAPQTIQNNLTMICDLADAHKIKVILASILPIHDYNKDKNPAWEVSKRRPMASIKAMNDWMEQFCARRRYLYLNYSAAMIDEKGYLKAELADDGLHPNSMGYRVMAPLALAAIDKLVPRAQEEPKKRRRLPF